MPSITPDREWTRAEVIEALQRCAETEGQANDKAILFAGDYQAWAAKNDAPDIYAVRRVLGGGWGPICEDAGLLASGYGLPNKTKEQVSAALNYVREAWSSRPMRLRDAIELSRELPEEQRITVRDIYYYWGTWVKAALAHGISPSHRQRVRKDPAWLEQARPLLPASERRFNARRQRGTVPNAAHLARLYGGWIKFQLEAGVTEAQIKAAMEDRSYFQPSR